MKTFSQETRDIGIALSSGYCQCSPECMKKGTQAHHMLANSKWARKRYPNFLQSLFNFCWINHDCHMTKPLPTITPRQADFYEEWLRNFKESK